MVDYSWPAPASRRLIGKRISRLDGPAKVTGAAKYTYDVHRPGMLYAKVLRCSHAHARVAKLDLSQVETMPGVKAVVVIQGEGSEIQWALDEVAAVAATSEELAGDAVRAAAAAVRYEVLPHFVDDYALDRAPATKPGESESVGDADGELARSAVKLRRRYGLPPLAPHVL